MNTYSRLIIHLDHIVSNYKKMCSYAPRSLVGACVKANAYGLGMVPISKALFNRGCRHFFVAYFDEARLLRSELPQDASIYVFNGPYLKGFVEECRTYDLIPIFNTFEAYEEWMRFHTKTTPRYGLHMDTGMNRLGLSRSDFNRLQSLPKKETPPYLILSHLCSSENPLSPSNTRQLEAFLGMASLFPRSFKSLANSSGLFLGDAYHFDIIRPGMALYGLNPTPYQENPLTFALTLEARILQIQTLRPHETVGYGETFQAQSPMRIATLACGYADGIPWRLSGSNATCQLYNQRARILGRVSMDLITIDVTHIHAAKVNDWVTLLSPSNPIESCWVPFADQSPYELLSNMGARFERFYGTQEERVAC